MLAGPTSTLGLMCRAVARTYNTLMVASTVDKELTDADRAFFAAEAQKVLPLRDALVAKKRQIEDLDLGAADLNQAAVLMGDLVLDRGARAGNTRTKLGLSGKSGLGAAHVFGSRVDDLTGAPLKLQPSLVREAAGRLDDVADFDDKAKVKADLLARAEQQEDLLRTRDEGIAARSKLVSEGVRLVVDGAEALAKTKAALDGRFPRQRAYVATFFLDVSHKRRGGGDGDPGDDSAGRGAAPDGG
jgi:hypothetical protein